MTDQVIFQPGFTELSSPGPKSGFPLVLRVPALDLSFPRFDRDAELTVLPGDLAVLIVGVAARQAASHTAAIQASFARGAVDPKLFAPLHGAFNGPMAEALTRWKDE